MYLNIGHAIGYIEEKGVNKYLVFDSTDKNKELIKKSTDVFNGIKDKIKEINSNECDYEKDYIKIKFNSDDDLPLNKSLKSRLMTITIRSIFDEDGKLYRQVFLDDTFYELDISKCLNTKKLIFQKVFMLLKEIYQKNATFATIGILKISVLNISVIFEMDVMI